MDVEPGIKGRLSSRHVTVGQRAPGYLSSYIARWIDLHKPAVLATAVGDAGARSVTAVGRSSDVNLICARRFARKTKWRIGATNPTSNERTKYARLFGKTFSGNLSYTDGVVEKSRYAYG